MSALISDAQGVTVWGEHSWPAEPRGGMVLTPRINCSSLRLRRSEPGYRADWHVAGEPVLIVVQRGVLRVIVRDGRARDFGPGDGFIAADAVPAGRAFDAALHGHQAEVIGDTALEAVHIKLDPASLHFGR